MRSPRHIQSVLFVVVIAFGVLLAGPRAALAQVSAGCTAANQNNTNFSSATFLGFTFNAGETVSFAISGGTATGSSIVVGGVTQASSSSNPNTIFFTFPVTQVYSSVRFEADPQPGAIAGTFVVVCPTTIAARSIPTVSQWGLILLVLSLFTLGARHLMGRRSR